MASEEGGREREREEGVVVFQWLPAERAQAWCQRCGTNRSGEVFELGPCIQAETVKVCALIGLHMMAEENALRTVTLLLSWEICESMAARKALFGAAVVVSAQEVRARLLLRITSTTSITSLLKPFPQHGRAVTFEERDVLGEINGVRVNSVNELACLILRFLLQFEHGVCPFFRMTVFLLFVCVPPCFVWSSGGRKEALQPFGSFVAKIGRMVETPKLFMVRAFHLLVSLTGTGDGCFLLEPRSFDSKSLWKATDGVVTTKWWSVGVMVWARMEKRWLFCTWCGSKGCAENSRCATDSVHCSVGCNDKFSQFRVFRNCGSSAKCNKPKGWSMTLSRKRKLFFEFSCSLISKKEQFCFLFAIFVWKKPRASLLKIILLLLFYAIFSSFIDSLFVLWSQWHGHRPRVILCSKPSHSFSCFFFFSCFHWFLFFFYDSVFFFRFFFFAFFFSLFVILVFSSLWFV